MVVIPELADIVDFLADTFEMDTPPDGSADQLRFDVSTLTTWDPFYVGILAGWMAAKAGMDTATAVGMARRGGAVVSLQRKD